MDGSDLTFKLLLDDLHDARSIADRFLEAKLGEYAMNSQLTRLILLSCGIQNQFDMKWASTNSLKKMADFIGACCGEMLRREAIGLTVPLHDTKFMKKIVSFFEHLLTREWDRLTNNGKFDSYFALLVNKCTSYELVQLHTVGFAIKLKLVTAYLKKHNIKYHQSNDVQTDETLRAAYDRGLPTVFDYASATLKGAIFYKTLQCGIMALTEMVEWISMDGSFASDSFLRVLTWCMKMEKPKLVTHSLMMTYKLLRMPQLYDRLTLFVAKLGSTFEDLHLTPNINIFDWVVCCSEIIYKEFPGALTDSYIAHLLDNMLASDHKRARIAGRFYVNALFDGDNHPANFKRVFDFLDDKDLDAWKLVVDALLDEYPALSDWPLLVDMILDRENKHGLKMVEKENLLFLVSFAVEELVNGYRPLYRGEDPRNLNMQICHKHACNFTQAFMPNLWDLFGVDFSDVDQARRNLIFVTKFCNFEFMSIEERAKVIDKCVSTFKNSPKAATCDAALSLIMIMMDTSKEEKVADFCHNGFVEIRKFTQLRMDTLVEQFYNNPERFAEPNSELAKEASLTLIRMCVMNRRMLLEVEYIYDLPKTLIEGRFMGNNQTFIAMLYVCVILLCDYAVYLTKTCRNWSDDEQLRHEMSEEGHVPKDAIARIGYVVRMMSVMLPEWCQWLDLGLAAYLGLCKVLVELRKNVDCFRKSWNELFPNTARYLVTGYVASMVWNTKATPDSAVDKNMKTYVLQAFLELIKYDALPLYYACDPMAHSVVDPEVIDERVTLFLSDVFATTEVSVLVNWLLKWFQCLYTSSSLSDCVDVARNFIKILHPLRTRLVVQSTLVIVIREGIDYALGQKELVIGGVVLDKADTPRYKFLDVLVELTVCLNDDAKKSITEYFLSKKATTSSSDGAKAMKNFVKNVKRKFVAQSSTPQMPKSRRAMRNREGAAEFAGMDDDDEVNWTLSSTCRSSCSGDADDSDNDSGGSCSSDKSMCMYRGLTGKDTMCLSSMLWTRLSCQDNEEGVHFVAMTPRQSPIGPLDRLLADNEQMSDVVKNLQKVTLEQLETEGTISGMSMFSTPKHMERIRPLRMGVRSPPRVRRNVESSEASSPYQPAQISGFSGASFSSPSQASRNAESSEASAMSLAPPTENVESSEASATIIPSWQTENVKFSEMSFTSSPLSIESVESYRAPPVTSPLRSLEIAKSSETSAPTRATDDAVYSAAPVASPPWQTDHESSRMSVMSPSQLSENLETDTTLSHIPKENSPSDPKKRRYCFDT